MVSIQDMSRAQIKKALRSLRTEWENPPTTEQTDMQKELLRGLYDQEQDETEIFFYSQDDNGFPVGSRIADSRSGVRVYPTLQLSLAVDRDRWTGIKRPEEVSPENWPPDQISDLIPTAGKSERCFKCHKVKTCKCDAGELPAWIDYWQTNWTNDFRIKPAGNRGLGLFANTCFDIHDVLGQYTGELLPNIGRNKTSYDASFSIGKYNPKPTEKSICIISAANRGSAFRFLNHSCNPNAEFLIRKCGPKSRRLVAVTARQAINEDDEITINYGKGYFNPCLCEQCESQRTKSKGRKRKFEEVKSSNDDTEDSDSGNNNLEDGSESDKGISSSSPEPPPKKAKKSAPSGKKKSAPSEEKKSAPLGKKNVRSTRRRKKAPPRKK